MDTYQHSVKFGTVQFPMIFNGCITDLDWLECEACESLIGQVLSSLISDWLPVLLDQSLAVSSFLSSIFSTNKSTSAIAKSS